MSAINIKNFFNNLFGSVFNREDVKRVVERVKQPSHNLESACSELDRLKQTIDHTSQVKLDYKELALRSIEIISNTPHSDLVYLGEGEDLSVLGIYDLYSLRDAIDIWKKYLMMSENKGINKILNFVRKHDKAVRLCLMAGTLIATFGALVHYYLNHDSDNDGLINSEEIFEYHTNPHNSDTDGDHLLDNEEIFKGTNPLIYTHDPDEDSLPNRMEQYLGTNPYEPNIDPDKDGIPNCDDKFPFDPEIDTDQDGLSDYFETNILHTDPTKPNDRYVILLDTGGSKTVEEMYNFFVYKNNISSGNIIKLKGKNATTLNFENAISQITERADRNDMVYIFLESHGGKGTICLYEGNTLKEIKYEKIDNWTDKINAKKLAMCISACYSGSAIEYLKEGPCPRIVITAANENQKTYWHLLSGNFLGALNDSEKYDLADNKLGDANGYVSLMEAFLCAKHFIESNTFVHPQINDISEIAPTVYLGDYNPKEGY